MFCLNIAILFQGNLHARQCLYIIIEWTTWDRCKIKTRQRVTYLECRSKGVCKPSFDVHYIDLNDTTPQNQFQSFYSDTQQEHINLTFLEHCLQSEHVFSKGYGKQTMLVAWQDTNTEHTHQATNIDKYLWLDEHDPRKLLSDRQIFHRKVDLKSRYTNKLKGGCLQFLEKYTHAFSLSGEI